MIKFLLYTSPLVFIYPLIVCCVSFLRQASVFRVICLFVIVAFTVEVLSTILWYNQKNNLFLLHIYTPIELLIISIFYYNIFKRYVKKWIIPLLCCLFIICSIFDSLFIHGISNFNIYARSIESIIIISYSLFFFYKKLGESNIKSTLSFPLDLINSAFLIYFSISFFLFLFSNYINDETLATYIAWGIHAIALWLLYTTIGIALWKAGKS